MGAIHMNNSEIFLTPLPSFDFLADEVDAVGATGGHRRLTGRGLVISATAVLSVTGLLGTIMLPTPIASVSTAVAAELPAQGLVGAPAAFATDSLDTLRVFEVPAAPVTTQLGSSEPGLVDPAGLTDAKLRYPFDQTMPLTDGFGYRTAPVEQFHDAQDIAAANGTPIRVIGDGVIVEASWANDGCGFSLKVQHLVDGQDLTSRYCHMEAGSHSYEVGDRVRIGDEAGRVGNTGMSFGAHLHLALRLNGEPIDPLPFIESSSR